MFLQPPIEIGPNEHPLQFGYALWYTRNPIGKITDSGYAQNLKLVGRFASVEQFWALYSHLSRPSALKSNSDFHLFKNGIKPMWEVSKKFTGATVSYIQKPKFSDVICRECENSCLT